MNIKKIGSGTYKIHGNVSVLSCAAVVGDMEKKGPLGHCFEHYSSDEYFGQDSFEKAESYMQKEAMKYAVEKSGYTAEDIEFIFAGDLLNQCIGSNYSVRDTAIQFFGLYGACSTMAEGLILGAMAIDGGFASRVIAMTSSHFCSAERQFRFPLEYGAVRPRSAQWTVTGAGCVVLGCEKTFPRIRHVCPGAVCDMGIKDMGNMGAAMAPAAALTLKRFLDDTGTTPEDYDLILSGDLGEVGYDLLKNLLSHDNIFLGNNYDDCGRLIYDRKTQDVHSGGSGCGCSASVLTRYVLPKMRCREYNNVLFMTTGALMSPISSLQGETIPGIAHLVHLQNDGEVEAQA